MLQKSSGSSKFNSQNPLLLLVTTCTVYCLDSQEIEPENGGTESDSASMQKGLGVLTVILLVMITIQLF